MVDITKEMFDEDNKRSNHSEEDSDEDEEFKKYLKVLKSI